MTVLITGASGFIGSQLLTRIASDDVVGLARSKPSSFAAFPFFESEINGKSDYSKALNNVRVVIHLAARVHVMEDTSTNPLEDYREVNTYGTINLAKQAARAGVKRFIFISSIKSNGESSKRGKPFRYDDPLRPEDFYGQSKSEAEELLLQVAHETGMEVVIIRPTLVYGPNVKANFASLLNLISKGIPLPFGCITDNRRSLVSVTNLVDLIVTCIDHPKAANQVFLVSDDHDVSTSEMIHELATALNKFKWQIPLPIWCYKLAGRIFSKSGVVDRLTGSLQVDITHTKETLGWIPPQTLEEGFKETASAFLESKKKRGQL
ncbi:UDP-glucose 4-epimerase family protein [Vibrio harveyi]|uniref:UDP-glucose 4-epimerase family protein n=1 Tax=Vibrio harveyi TaxID=669 RepID=UPI002380B6E4|nr:SDR family oxidoreductase [Vibrio harveyi]